MQRSFAKRIGYDALRLLCRLFGVVLFGLRCVGRHWQPPRGRALICSNHQSYFDPILVGLAFNRRMNYVARKSLFSVPLLGGLIRYLDAIPIDREGSGLEGVKETLRRLKRDEMVLIFPEGTRSPDGRVAALKPGFVALARRGKTPLIPVGLDGAYDAWPRKAKLPHLVPIRVCIGEPLSAAQIAGMTDEEVVAELERRIRQLHRQARHGRGDAGNVA